MKETIMSNIFFKLDTQATLLNSKSVLQTGVNYEKFGIIIFNWNFIFRYGKRALRVRPFAVT